MLEPYDSTVLWIVVIGFIISFILAMGIGSNDVANSFGTSVGSGVLSLKKACFLATIFEISGAVLIGYRVADTVRKGILDVTLYNGTEKELMLGTVASLSAGAVWQFVATFMRMPVSGSHSVVGAVVGVTLVTRGKGGVQWMTIWKIAASWVISPFLAGVVSAGIYHAVKFSVIDRNNPLKSGLRALPLIYAMAFFVNAFSVIHNGPQILYFHYIPWWGALAISTAIAIVTIVVVQMMVVPKMRRRLRGEPEPASQPGFFSNLCRCCSKNSQHVELTQIPEKVTTETPSRTKTVSVGTDDIPYADGAQTEVVLNGVTEVKVKPIETKEELAKQLDDDEEEAKNDTPEVAGIFSFLQILTACFGSFAHGGNDVSNAIGPLITLWMVYQTGSSIAEAPAPLYLLLFGGSGIAIGLWIWGRRVIETIGSDLTNITPSSGFTIEIGAALVVLLASKIGLPISTTHCKVGSVVFVGWVKGNKSGVDWSIFRNIIMAWIVTVPATCIMGSGIMAMLEAAFL